MQLVEKHIIKKSHKYYKELDNLCFLSKNLYNAANYIIRQEFISNKKYINFNALDKLLNCGNHDYKQLPAKVAQQVLRLLDKNWVSFFVAIKGYAKTPSKYLGRPNLPKYKDRAKGRNVVIYTKQALSKKELRKGIVKPSKTKVLIKTKVDPDTINQVRIVPSVNNVICVEIIYTVPDVPLKTSNNIIGIDLGVNNLATVVNNYNSEKFIINGRPLKSVNAYYNKKKARLMSFVGGKGTSNKIKKLTNKRNNKVRHYLHNASKYVVNYCLTNDVSKVIIGHNKEWKNGFNKRKDINQNFICIPFNTLISQLKYKCALQGIELVETEEGYTSKCSFVDNEKMKHYNKYIGRRISRGVFKTGSLKYNADVNGALNIIRKVIPTFGISEYGIQGVVVHPARITPCKV